VLLMAVLNKFQSKATVWLTGAVLLLASVLRFLWLDADSLWLDEMNSLLVATVHGYPQQLPEGIWTPQQWFDTFIAWQPMNWDVLIAMLRQNVHMPLYYLLLNPWLSWVGLTEIGLRSFSAVFSVMALWTLWGLSRTLSFSNDPKTLEKNLHWPVWTVLIAGFAPFQLTFAQEGRMYTLALWLSVLSAWGLFVWTSQIIAGNRRHYLALMAYTASMLLGVFTHYTFVFQVAFHMVWVLVCALRQWQRHWLWFGIPLILLGLFAYWWAPVYIAQKITVTDEHHFSDGLLAWHRYLQALVTTPFYWWAGFVNKTQSVLLPIYVALMVFGSWCAVQWTLKANKILQDPLVFVVAWLWLPLAGQIAVDWVQQTHTATIVRYTLLSAPAIYLLFGWVVPRIVNEKPWVNHGFVALAIVFILYGFLTIWPNQPFRYTDKFPTREMVRYLDQHLGPHDLILVNGPLATPALLAFYLKDDRPNQSMRFWARLPQFSPQPKPPTIADFSPYNQVWLYFNRGNQRRGALLLRGILEGRYSVFQHHIGPRRKLSVYSHEPSLSFIKYPPNPR